MAGYKNDEGKNRMSLIPPIVERAIGAALTHGATKYPEYNWAEGMRYSRVMDAVRRHLNAWWEGENIDPESKLSHLWLALTGMGFLVAYEEYGIGKDDRFPWRRETPFDLSDVVRPKVPPARELVTIRSHTPIAADKHNRATMDVNRPTSDFKR